MQTLRIRYDYYTTIDTEYQLKCDNVATLLVQCSLHCVDIARAEVA